MPPTIGAAFVPIDIYKKGQNLTLNLWDTSGQEAYDSLTSQYYKGTNIAIIVIDCQVRNSL